MVFSRLEEFGSLFSTTEMAATEIDNVVTTKLLTLLNASATKIRTRKRDFDYPLALPPVKKMGGKRVVVPNMEEEPKESEREPKEVGKEGAMVMANDEKDAESAISFVASFSRFSSKMDPSWVLGALLQSSTCQFLYGNWPAFIMASSRSASMSTRWALSSLTDCLTSSLQICYAPNPY